MTPTLSNASASSPGARSGSLPAWSAGSSMNSSGKAEKATAQISHQPSIGPHERDFTAGNGDPVLHQRKHDQRRNCAKAFSERQDGQDAHPQHLRENGHPQPRRSRPALHPLQAAFRKLRREKGKRAWCRVQGA